MPVMYHQTVEGPKLCRAERGVCPLQAKAAERGEVVKHFTSLEEAKQDYAETLAIKNANRPDPVFSKNPARSTVPHKLKSQPSRPRQGGEARRKLPELASDVPSAKIFVKDFLNRATGQGVSQADAVASLRQLCDRSMTTIPSFATHLENIQKVLAEFSPVHER